MQQRQFYVYIMANARPSLYVGITNDLVRRVYEHKESSVEGFTKQYKTNKLVYYDVVDIAEAAIHREKRLKKWNRDWKLKLIHENNPNLDDLYEEIIGGYPGQAGGRRENYRGVV